jgi:hypothetical protein
MEQQLQRYIKHYKKNRTEDYFIYGLQYAIPLGAIWENLLDNLFTGF